MINLDEILCVPGVYKFTNLLNNKIYIGESLELKIRISGHKTNKDNDYFHRALRKWGWDNFDVEILQEYPVPIDEATRQRVDAELLALETAFIDFFDSDNHQVGYNILKFGLNRTGIKASEESKKKMSENSTGSKNNFYGRKHTEESKRRMSKSHIGLLAGENHPRFGKKVSNETKRKISTAKMGKPSGRLGKKCSEEQRKTMRENRPDFTGKNNPMYGRNHSLESRQKMSEALTGKDRSKFKKPIKQIDLKTKEVIKVWPSATDAAAYFNVSSGLICSVCRKTKQKRISKKDSSVKLLERRGAVGFGWEYVNKEHAAI